MTSVIAVVSDLHVNSTVALCPPSFTLDDGGTYRASRPQTWIWRQWLSYWQTVREWRDSLDAPLRIIVNGELGDNNHHHTTQLITRNEADIVRMAAEVMRPATDLLREGDHLFVTRGTEAHSGPSASIDERIAADLGATPARDDEPPVSWWQLRAEFDGVTFDVMHHPPGSGGRLPWTRGNFANKLAAIAYMEAGRKEQPPHLLIRGHIHAPADSQDTWPVRAVIAPSWKLKDAYAYRIGGGFLPVGGLIITCHDGGYELRKMLYHWPVERYRRF